MLDLELEKRMAMSAKLYQAIISSIQGRFRKVDETPTHIVVGLFKSLNYRELSDIALTHICDFYAGYGGDNTSHKTHFTPVYPVEKNRSMYSGFIMIEKGGRGNA